MLTICAEQRRARLAVRHRLTGGAAPASEPRPVETAADDLVALHSTDPPSVFLSLWARVPGLTRAQVEHELYDVRTLVRHHGMRRTLWVTPRATTADMHAAVTRAISVTERRRTEKILADNGIDHPARWLDQARDQILRFVAEQGPVSTREIGRALPELAHPLALSPGKSYAARQAAHGRVIAGLGFDAELVRARPASWVSGEYAWATPEQWLGGPLVDGSDPECAARDLVLRWLRRFGPGTTADLKWWTGWTLTRTRSALAAAEAVEVDLDGQPGWVAPGDEHAVDDPGPWEALLPALDPTTMGWKDRSFYLPESATRAFDTIGNAGPTIWADGRVVGAWARDRSGTILLDWFEALPARRRRRVAERAEQLQDWLGDDHFSVRFPSAAHAELLQVPPRRAPANRAKRSAR